MSKMTSWRTGIIITLCLSMSTFAAIVNRYSFTGDSSVNSAIDTVSGKTGTFAGNAAISSNQLVLDGTDDWVTLPADVLSTYTSASIETWFTLDAVSTWARVFDFGDISGTTGGYYWFYAPSGGGTSRLVISTAGFPGSSGEQITTSTILSAATAYHLVCVYDAAAGQMRVYQNGALISSVSVTTLLSDVHRTYAYIGKSLYSSDPELDGTINEFRIHDTAMTDVQVAASYAAGPDTIAGDYIGPHNPSPADGSQSLGVSQTLSWTSDTTAGITGHRVYLGTDYNSVLNATTSSTGIYQGTTASGVTSFAVTLLTDTQYYWRIEDVTPTGTLNGPVWALHTYNPKAISPSPASGTIGIPISGTTLSWTASSAAVSHRVYFGLSPETLQLMEDYYPSTSWPTGALNYSKTYYWRIDERESSGAIFTGDVWNLSTMQGPQACIPGDLDGDCFVGIEDLLLFTAQWLTDADCIAFDCPDLDQNQFVNLSDAAVLASNWQQEHDPLVIINEIHYHTDNNKQPVEFIELYNAGALQINLSNWILEDAIDYTFPAGTMLDPGQYLVVSQNPTAVTAKFGVSSLGPWTGKLSNEGEKITLRDALDNKIDEVNFGPAFPWPTAADGEGASMELLNPYIDNDLGGSWRASGYHQDEYDLAFGAPTPGQINSVYLYTQNVPPQTRQVNHAVVTPLTGQDIESPRPGQSVRITAKVTDPDGVQQVNLKYQIVTPGNYIPAYLPVSPISSLISDPTLRRSLNPAFEDAANWTTVAMVDNGTNGDAVAGDDIYTAVIAGQSHRTLVRYRIEAQDKKINTVRVPYYDDGSMNFAYFVYNGVPAYTANTDTVQSAAPYTYSAAIMKALPDYTLITRAADLYQCNGYNAADRIDQATTSYNSQEAGKVYNWEGTLVYDGKVYDHVDYRLRGGNGRYSNGRGGKRSMKFVFPRGNYFQARDISGKKFPDKWQHLLTGKMLGNWYGYSGYDGYMYGVNELINMKFWNIVGVPAPEGYWFTFRVIDDAAEVPTTTTGQYDGDFWGLYIGWEDYDGAFLENHGMPDGNLYKLSDKIYEGWRQSRYQAPDAVENTSGATGSAADYENIRWNMTASATAAFVQNYMDTDEWIRYQTIKEAVRHYDMFSGAECTHCLKNSAWYFYPEYSADNNYYGRLWFLPFDVDDTWGPYFNKGVDHGRAAIFDELYITEGNPVQQTVQAAKAPIKQDYRNYIREFRDLFWQPEIIEPMIDELASKIASIVPADRDRWRLEPGFSDDYRSDPGPLNTIVANMKSFAFQPTTVYAYWVGSSANLDTLASAENDGTNIPGTPTITYIGTAGYPENDLRFQTTAFSDPQGSGTFAAMKWRIARVDNSGNGDYDPNNPRYEIQAKWESDEITNSATTTAQIPADQVEVGGTYRARCRFKDNTGRWGHWSSPIQFTTTAGLMTDLLQNLRLTELMYNPAEPSAAEITAGYADNDLFEFVELRNTGTTTLDLTDTYFSDGIEYYFGGAVIQTTLLSTGFDSSEDGFTYADNTFGANSSAAVTNNAAYATGTYEAAGGQTGGGLYVYLSYPTSNPMSGGWSKTFTLTQNGTVTINIAYRMIAGGGLDSDEWCEAILKVDNAWYGTATNNSLVYTLGNGGTTPNDDSGWLTYQTTIGLTAGTHTITLGGYCNKANSTGGTEWAKMYFDNVSISTITTSTYTLPANSYVLVVKNKAAFEARYGTGLSSLIAGQYTGSLNNAGETIRLTDAWDGNIFKFTYNDGYGWPVSADGPGHSLVPIDSAIAGEHDGSLEYCGNWRASAYIKGSPGIVDPTPTSGMMINEVMAHTDTTEYPGYDSNDWIELYNPTGASINYNSSWYLSDNPDNLKKWALPSGSIAAGGRVTFDEVTGFHAPITSGFGLDKSGEYVILSYLPGTSADRVVDYVRFSGQYNTISWGRYADGGAYWFFLADPGTRNAANANPVQHPVVISEIMYHPQEGTTKEEYIELYNPTGSAVNLYNANGAWRLDNAVSYTFPSGTNIPASGSKKIVVVPFDPAVDTDQLAAFNTAYGCSLVAGTTIFGPWTGDLSNAAERLALQEPQEADPPSITTIWWITVDQVNYADCSPWVTSPDGTGTALIRSSSAASASGDNPANWVAGTPSPGY